MRFRGKNFTVRVTIERRKALVNICLGLAITAIFTAAQYAGLLASLERQAYDWRVRQFQMNNPGPTDRLVHLDMDDGALEKIGLWPWPRDRFARIVDEVARANAKVMMFDILFGEADSKSAIGDAALARSMKAFGRVVLPMSVTMTPPPPQFRLAPAIEKEFAGDLSLEDDLIVKHLLANKQIEVSQKEETLSVITKVRRDLFYREVYAALRKDPATSFEQLRARLLKSMDPTIRMDTRLDNLQETIARVQKEQALLRFTIPKPSSSPALFNVVDCIPPMTVLQASAHWSGIVDSLIEPDGRLRTQPLFVDFHGRMMPSAAFMTALALLDVPLESVKVSPASVSFPLPKGGTRVIPVRTFSTDANGTGGLVMDIGWWGSSNWKTMYDFPRYRESAQHMNLSQVWTAVQLQDRLENNRSSLDYFIRFILVTCDRSEGQSGYNAYLEAAKAGSLTAEDIQGYINLYGDYLTPELERLRLMEKTEGKSAEITERIAKLTSYDKQANQIVKGLRDVETALETSRKQLREAIEGKAVILGWTATGKVDRYGTPVHADAAPGVVAHGAILSGILTGYLWGHASPVVTIIATLIIGIATTLCLALFAPVAAFMASLALGIGYALFNGFYLFNHQHIVVGLIAPSLAGISVWAVVTLVRYISDLRERRRIEKRVSSYLDPQLVDYLIEHPDEDFFSGVEKEISVAFTDLEGSTNITERLGKGLVAILNEYMGLMTPVVRLRDGFIDKFLGDGIMFMFNALEPSETHAADAVATALRMQELQAEFNQTLTARGLPTLGTRIGINTGLMIMGDAGSEKAANFTVLGDNVNLASRMEGANKPFGSKINISDRTYELCRDQFCFRPLGRIRVKGKEQAVMCWEPLCTKDKLTPEIEKKIALSTAVFNAFVEGRFEDCMRACDAMDAELGPTKYAAIYHKSATHCLAEGAGDGFDGVITLTDK